MTRKAIKRRLRRAEAVFFEDRYAEAELVYRSLLEKFQRSDPSFLDRVACIYGLIQSLHFQGETAEASALAQRASYLLEPGRAKVPVAC